MKDNTIESKQQFFATKEDYLAMRKAWATYFNTEARKLERNEYGNKIRKLQAEHFILYALLRGKDPNQHWPKNSVPCMPSESWCGWILKPFGDTLSKEQYKVAFDILKQRGF